VIRVHVKNFQSIADATVEIDGFTVITGTNNTGKSALMRAIHGVFTNPAPGSIVRTGADFCSVKLEFPDGNTVKWEKGHKGVNRYWLNDRFFDKVGAGVPDEIQKLGYSAIEVGGNRLWPQFAKQKKGDVFLLDLPGSAVADAVANVERIRVLNHALKACESERRTVNGDLKLRRKDGEKLDAAVEKFEGLDDAVALLDGLAEQREKAEKMVKLQKLLSGLQAQIAKATAGIEKLDGFDIAKGTLPGQGVLDEIKTVRADRKALTALKGRLETRRERVEHWQGAAEVATSASPGDDQTVVQANKIRQGRKVLVRLQKGIADGRAGVEREEKLLAQKKDELKQAEAAVVLILGDYEDCPTCGTTLHGAA